MVAEINISVDVIIILPIALLELTRPLSLMVLLFYHVTTTSHERTIKRVKTKMPVTFHGRSRREEG
jgi:hypothetical protein